jgi:glycosyltransferase involved in cell wall biosynthesis
LTISYPLADKLKISKTKNNVANISMVGCGRKDKGFFEIKKIEYELANANVNYQIIAQDMDEYDLSYSKKYSYGLTDSRQITLLPSHLTDDEIESLYSCADIILLPYDSGVYKYRGSAVYQEGLSYGKLFVCYSGSGMDAWINKYGNGILVQNHTGVAMAIAKLLSLSSEEVANIVNAAKKKYVNDFQLAIKRVI